MIRFKYLFSPLVLFYSLLEIKFKDHYIIEDAKHNHVYYLNICAKANVTTMPKSCQAVARATPSPVYQYARDNGNCYWLGSLEKSQWELIDPKVPEKGVDLIYHGGQKCSNGRPREVRIHLLCAQGYNENDVPFSVVETPSPHCHYNVTWPTTYACPRRVWPQFTRLFLISLCMISMYILLGCILNNLYYRIPLGWGAVPTLVPRFLCSRFCVERSKMKEDDLFFEQFPMEAEKSLRQKRSGVV